MERRGIKATVFVLAMCLMAFLASCATCPVSLPCPSCPLEDIVFPVMTPIGPIAIQVDKDFFNEANEGRGWMTLEDFLKRMEEDGRPDRQLLKEAGPGDGPA